MSRSVLGLPVDVDIRGWHRTMAIHLAIDERTALVAAAAAINERLAAWQTPGHLRRHRLTHGPASATPQQSNTDQQMSLRRRWSSSTSSRISCGSCSRCHHARAAPPLRLWSAGVAAARTALIAYAAAPSS